MGKERISEKIQKLLSLASNNPSDEEARSAMLKAQELMLKYHIENPEDTEKEEVVMTCYYLGLWKMTEFILLLSVLCARYFRSKTIHDRRKVYFIGFAEDVAASREVYSYLLDHAEKARKQYFKENTFSFQADMDWKYGFIYGLHQAFDSRKGYELMLKVPQKVEDAYKLIPKVKDHKGKGDSPKDIKGAFTEGYRSGKTSLDSRELAG